MERQEIWWLNPTRLAVFLLLPAYVILYFAPTFVTENLLLVRFQIYWGPAEFLIGLIFILAFIAGSAAATVLKVPQVVQSANSGPIRNGYLDLLAFVTILAYLIWFHDIFFRLQFFVDLFHGSFVLNLSRDQNQNIPGVTSFTQLGVVYAVFYFDKIWRCPDQGVRKRHTVFFFAILVLTMFRVVAWGERLALIEFLLPAIVTLSNTPRFFVRKVVFRVWSAAPFFGVVLLFLFFSATEFLRSWATHYVHQNVGFIEFAAGRLLTYYYTALNNGAALIALLDWPTWHFEHVLAWLHKLPIVGGLIKLALGWEWSTNVGFLSAHADPEFNNMSGIFSVVYDVGIPAAFILAWGWGGVLGVFYNQMRSGSGIGLWLYPALFVSLIEMFRIFYLGESRLSIIFVGLVIGIVFFRHTPRSKRAVIAQTLTSKKVTAAYE